MKKISIYTFSLLVGASLVACDNYKEPNPPAQYNPQAPVLENSEITEAKVVGDQVYNLQQMYDAVEYLDIASVTCDKLADGYTFGGEGWISTNNFETSFPVAMSSIKSEDSNEWILYVTPENLNNAYRENISRTNADVTLQFRFNLTTLFTTEQGNQVAYIGGEDYYYGPYNVNISPIPEDKVYFPYLYTPGVYNNWNQSESQMLYTLITGDLAYVEYKGFAIFADSYKYCSTLSGDDGIYYGLGEETGTLSTDETAENINVDEEGLYYSQVHIEDLTYSNYLVETIGLIGDATPGGWDESTPLTSDNYLVWSANVYLVPGPYKFRCNNDWVVDLGGTPDHLEFGTNGGGDIAFDGEEGEYIVTLDLSKLPYSCTIVAQ